MAAFSFKNLAENLLTLEVNTIIKADMSACKLPALRREALWEIAKEYHFKLVELECREPQVWMLAGLMSFRELRERAESGVKAAGQALERGGLSEDEQLRLREKLTMLNRIQTQSDQIVSLFIELGTRHDEAFDYRKEVDNLASRRQEAIAAQGGTGGYSSDPPSAAWNNDLDRRAMQRAPDLGLDAAEVSLIRKIWEIGTERIVLQTVISADGDVTTRMSERFARNYHETVLNIHHSAVNTSVGFWFGLIRTVGELASGFLGKLLGR